MDSPSKSEPNASTPAGSRAGDDMIMPPGDEAAGSQIIEGGAQGAEPITIDAPPASVGRQMAQLIIIPAVIVAVAVGVALLFGKVAGTADSIDDHIRRLQQSDSGQGRNLPGGLQDPRYKDRMLEAYNIATLIPSIKTVEEKKRVSDLLVETLQKHIKDDEDVLQLYLLTAIGRLGQEGGFEPVFDRLDSQHVHAREGAISGLLAWPDMQLKRSAIPKLVRLLGDSDPMVRAKASAALGALATPDDANVLEGLREAMNSEGLPMREVVWNAAIALARLGDDNGAQYVVSVLLNRQTLAKLPSGDPDAPTSMTLSRDKQDLVILSTLAATQTMPQAIVWDKIRELADKDDNVAVRSAARQVMAAKDAKQAEQAKPAATKPDEAK